MKILLRIFFLVFFIVLLLQLSATNVYPGWFKHYGGTNTDSPKSIQQTSDGGYIVAGNTMSYTYGSQDYCLYKLNSNGNKVWFNHYGGANTDSGQSIQQTTDGGYILAGYTNSYTYGDFDSGIYKLDSNGNK